MMIKTKYIYSCNHLKGNGKLKTPSPTYCTLDNRENMLKLAHTLDKLYLTSIFINSMSSDKVCTMMIMRWCNIQTNKYALQAKMYPTIFTHHKLVKYLLMTLMVYIDNNSNDNNDNDNNNDNDTDNDNNNKK